MKLKKLMLLCVLCPLLFSMKAQGNEYYSSCCPSSCLSGWTVYADWLYWNARRCDLDYAVPFNSSTINSIGDVFDVEPSYDHGFRVGIQKQCGCFFLEAFYTYYYNSERDSVVDPSGDLAGTRIVSAFSIVAQGSMELAKGKWTVDYNVGDILAGYILTDCCCFQTYVFGGFKLAYIDQKLETFYSTDEAISFEVVKVKEKIDMDAYGVDLGVGAKYDFWRCFNLFGRFSYDVLLGDFTRRFIYDTSINGGVTFANRVNLREECWWMVGVFNVTFGLGYNYHLDCCICADLGISVGYEFHQWINMPDFLDFQNESGEITFDRHLQSLGFDGLFVRVSLGF